MRVYILHKHIYTRRLKCIHHTRAYIVTSINIFAVVWLNTIICRFTPTCDRFAKKRLPPRKTLQLAIRESHRSRCFFDKQVKGHCNASAYKLASNTSVMLYCPSMTCKQWHCNKHPSRAITTVNGEKFRQNSTISTQYVNVRAQFKVNKNPDNYIILIINTWTYYQYFKLKHTQMHHTKGKTKANKNTKCDRWCPSFYFKKVSLFFQSVSF